MQKSFVGENFHKKVFIVFYKRFNKKDINKRTCGGKKLSI